ncbi:hypothetical protein BDN70DRAFT_598560 [Pholiota conissans]|uniref:F-box domain-containing protein n=1 Tax=Pholiota conissans TaxID=109636 RepID=A0A9P5Z635_9AGAR|nr:hypothetical protein BDN70DRAFT_598560 [Pholiota conissans]
MFSNPGPGDVYNLQVDLQVDNSQIMHESPASGGCLDLIVDTDKRLQLMISPNLQRRKSVRIASQIEASLASKLQGEGKSQRKAPLHLFMDLPLDLTYEIAKYLGPFDLLTFVRLNKRFRTVFLRRPATTVWRQCIANASLPPCPTDMTEPQYVSFMLIAGAFCMACGLDRTLKSYPTLRLRLCRKCAKKNLINGLEVCKMISELADTPRLLSVIPSSDSYFST